MLGELWQTMDGGGFSAAIAQRLLRFNGRLFKRPRRAAAHPRTDRPADRGRAGRLARRRAGHLRHAARTRARPAERHKLGAHYTPRAYVERLVLPTVIEPLRAEWEDRRMPPR